MSKLALALIAITAISVAVAVQAFYYNIQAADAQARLPNNSVRSETIVDGQVQTQDLADDAVTRPKMADDSVGSAEIENGAVTRSKLANGAVGLVVQERIGDSVTAQPGTANFAIVDCEDGEIAIAGGYRGGSDIRIITSEANGDSNEGWVVTGYNDGESSGGSASFSAIAECVRLTP